MRTYKSITHLLYTLNLITFTSLKECFVETFILLLAGRDFSSLANFLDKVSLYSFSFSVSSKEIVLLLTEELLHGYQYCH